jgi:hypothetical protein
MKNNTFKIRWLIPALGIALVGGGYGLTKTYLGYQEQIRSSEQLVVIVDHLVEGIHLNQILKQAQDTGCHEAAGSLDKLLAANIVAVNAELPSADAQARVLADVLFKHLAQQRSQNSPTGTAGAVGLSDRQLPAPGAVRQALASLSPGK